MEDSRKINPNRLLKDELAYELLIRGITSTGKVEDDRRLLREAQHLNYTIKAPMLDPHVEVVLAKSKMEELLARIDNFKTDNKDNDFDSIYNRLRHVLGRIERIEVRPHLRAQQVSLHTACLDLMSRLRAVHDQTSFRKEVSILDLDLESGANGEEIRTSSPQATGEGAAGLQKYKKDLHDITTTIRGQLEGLTIEPVPLAPQPIHGRGEISSFDRRQPDFEMYRHENVSKWGLTYDGHSTSLSAFILRIQELCEARGVSKAQLFRSVPDLLTGDALNYWRANRYQFSNWDDVVGGLRLAFQPYNYETRLWDEIRERTQHPAEHAVSYISVMEGLFHRLPNLPNEAKRLDTIKCNLLPYLQFEVTKVDIQSITDLIHFCRSIEESRAIAARYKPPPSLSSRLLEPDLGCQRTKDKFHVSIYTGLPITNPPPRTSAVESHGLPSDSSIPEVASTSSNQFPVKTVICWNCGEPGHTAPRCSAPETLYCHKCGQKGVSQWRCPKCRKPVPSRNDQSGNSTGGRIYTVSSNPPSLLTLQSTVILLKSSMIVVHFYVFQCLEFL